MFRFLFSPPLRGRGFDWVTFLAALTLVAVGTVFIHSASYTYERKQRDVARVRGYATKQVVWTGVALLAFAAAYRFPYYSLHRHAYLILGGCVALLILVLGVAAVTRGVRGWFNFGPVRLQPSELAKIGLNLALARYLMLRAPIRTLRESLGLFGLTALVAVPIIIEPDFGGTLILLPILLAHLIAGGLPLRYFALFGLIAALAVPVAWHGVLHEYQKERIRSFIGGNPDPDDAGSYQVRMALAAIGSGGVLGKGLFQGSQNRLNFLPERHTDFIYAVIGEEAGLFGAGTVLALQLLLLLGIVGAAGRAGEPFGRLICYGFAAQLGTQIFINVGMNMGLTPVTGLTLPFVSYGGSSLVVTFITLGLVLNIGASRPLVFIHEKEAYIVPEA